jgi:hypothetical protein
VSVGWQCRAGGLRTAWQHQQQRQQHACCCSCCTVLLLSFS